LQLKERKDFRGSVSLSINELLTGLLTFAELVADLRNFSKYVRFEVLTAGTMKIEFWDTENPSPTSQETSYVSATEPSRLMLCKV
jgi:hypothetical protein